MQHGPVKRWHVTSSRNASAGDASDDGAADLSNYQEMLEKVRELQAAGSLTYSVDLQAELGISKAVNRRLARLKTAGSVKQVGHGRNAIYVESTPALNPRVEAERRQGSFRFASTRGSSDPESESKAETEGGNEGQVIRFCCTLRAPARTWWRNLCDNNHG